MQIGLGTAATTLPTAPQTVMGNAVARTPDKDCWFYQELSADGYCNPKPWAEGAARIAGAPGYAAAALINGGEMPSGLGALGFIPIIVGVSAMFWLGLGYWALKGSK
jgi:hypothetical protein